MYKLATEREQPLFKKGNILLRIKKNLFWVSIVLGGLITWPSGSLFAESTGPMQAGTAASVEGEVKATTPPERAAHSLKSGDPIFMGDKLETGAVGQLQILLLDKTVFTLGPLSTITIDEFVYDPKNAGDNANMVKGVFRAVSGKMTQQKREDVPADFSAASKNSVNSTPHSPSAASFPAAQEDALKLADLLGNKDAVNTLTSKSSPKTHDQEN